MGVKTSTRAAGCTEYENTNSEALKTVEDCESIANPVNTDHKTFSDIYQAHSAITEPSHSSDACSEEDYTFLKDILQEGVRLPTSKKYYYLYLLAKGKNIAGDTDTCVDTPPKWYDERKFRKGQKFAMEHLFGISFSQLISVFILFSFPNAFGPIIFTRKAETPRKAGKRYFSTAARVTSLYKYDFWTEGSSAKKNLKLVRSMHANVRQQMSSCTLEVLKEKLDLSYIFENSKDILSTHTQIKEIGEYFKSFCPFSVNLGIFSEVRSTYLSQTEMAVTQFGLVGLMVLYPNKFGAPDATDDDLDCFLHLWRTIGYCLGIDDKYNLCNGSLEEVKERCNCMILYFFKPSLSRLTRDWEHMCRCLVEGTHYYAPFISFEVLLYYLTHVLQLHASRTYKLLSTAEKITFSVILFIMTQLLTFHWARNFFNWLFQFCCKKVLK